MNYENDASFNPGDYSEGFQSATRLTGSGYVVKMAIPWKNVTPEAWHTLGFDVQINDARGGERHGVAAWNDTTGQGWQDPSVYGNLTLIDSMDDLEEDTEEPEEPGEPGEPGKEHPVHPEHPGKGKGLTNPNRPDQKRGPSERGIERSNGANQNRGPKNDKSNN